VRWGGSSGALGKRDVHACRERARNFDPRCYVLVSATPEPNACRFADVHRFLEPSSDSRWADREGRLKGDLVQAPQYEMHAVHDRCTHLCAACRNRIHVHRVAIARQTRKQLLIRNRKVLRCQERRVSNIHWHTET
jgi:hypothetical protein